VGVEIPQTSTEYHPALTHCTAKDLSRWDPYISTANCTLILTLLLV